MFKNNNKYNNLILIIIININYLYKRCFGNKIDNSRWIQKLIWGNGFKFIRTIS
jgi:hypothetical protein